MGWKLDAIPGLRIGLLAGALSVTSATAHSADPHVDYLLHCGGCHLENGAGSPPQVPDLRNDLAVITRIPEGRAYMVRVPGSAQVPLSPERLAALLNWIVVSFSEDTRDFVPFDGDEVARLKAQVLADPLAIRDEIWEKAGAALVASDDSEADY